MTSRTIRTKSTATRYLRTTKRGRQRISIYWARTEVSDKERLSAKPLQWLGGKLQAREAGTNDDDDDDDDNDDSDSSCEWNTGPTNYPPTDADSETLVRRLAMTGTRYFSNPGGWRVRPWR